jgi:RNA polymerase sigma-70 factor (ECF subfamily)
MAALDDAALVASVRQGDLGAFEALYDRYKTMVFRTACAITHEPSAAEEITQECFVRAYRSLDKVDTSTCLGPWLHRIAANLSYNWWRVARRQWTTPLGDDFEGADRMDSERAAFTLGRENIRAIMQAVNSLCFDQRVTVILFYLNGLSLEEIAYVLDCPVGTVKSRLHYAKINLKKQLEQAWEPAPQVVYEPI